MEKFSRQPGLIHGFSTRQFGDLRVKKSLEENDKLESFLKALGLERKNLIMMEQVHGGKVKIVKDKNKGEVIKAVDGLVTDQPGIILGVKVADCLPLLFFDTQKRVIGIAHAGWEGILEMIGQKVIKKMEALDIYPQDILIGVGPHISGCCYEVQKDLINKFVKKFGQLAEMIFEDHGKSFLNLSIPLKAQLIKVGILEKNIELPQVCTYCQNDEFFSYRKDSQETYGEILGVISLKNKDD